MHPFCAFKDIPIRDVFKKGVMISQLQFSWQLPNRLHKMKKSGTSFVLDLITFGDS